MKKSYLSLLLILLAAVFLSSFAYAAPIKPVDDPWDDPENLEADGGTYLTYNKVGYVIIWESPECSSDGAYLILNNGRKLTVECRVTYMDESPWGRVTVDNGKTPDGKPKSFSGWVLMSDLTYENGDPVIAEPEPEPTQAPEPEVSFGLPKPPTQAITIVTTYNNAIVYTSVAIAAAAVVLVIIVLAKHKAVNKKSDKNE